MNEIKLEKLEKLLGKDTAQELVSLPETELKQRVVQANQSMKQAEEELEANAQYQQIKENKSLLEQGKKEVNKRQRAIIKYCLHLLDEKGKL